MNKSGIYIIANRENGKQYVGSAKSIRSRWFTHQSQLRRGVHCNAKLQASWNKYGEAAFSFTVVEYVEDASRLIEREQHWIDSTKPVFNIAPIAGSALGVVHSEETRRKVSEAVKKRGPRPLEVRMKISASHTGKKGPSPSTETRLKLSEAMKARGPRSDEYRANISRAQKGRVFSESHRCNISESRKGKGGPVLSDESRKRGDAKRRGVKRTPEQCLRIAEGVRAALARQAAAQTPPEGK